MIKRTMKDIIIRQIEIDIQRLNAVRLIKVRSFTNKMMRDTRAKPKRKADVY